MVEIRFMSLSANISILIIILECISARKKYIGAEKNISSRYPSGDHNPCYYHFSYSITTIRLDMALLIICDRI